jgi:Tfp pilus assembly protein PilV
VQLARFHKLTQKGDTIVEVLIAVAVVSAVLVGAFTIANRSSVQIRAAQERSEAQKLASSAIESLKARTTAANALALNKAYCIDLTHQATSSGTLKPLAAEQDTDYNASCRSVGTAVPYYISVTHVDNNGSFVIHARWDRVGGGDRQDVTYNYRLDP